MSEDVLEGVVKKGVVKWFDKRLGYGFIRNPDGRDVFVHYDAVPGEPGRRNLEEDDVVTYVERQHVKGLRAVIVLEIQREVTIH